MELFIALGFPSNVLDALEETQRQICFAGAAAPGELEARSDLHLTLRYLGPQAVPQQVVERLSLVTSPCFHLRLSGTGCFHAGRQRTLWSGVDGDMEGLAALKGAVDDALKVLPVGPEQQPFFPHITLAACPERDQVPITHPAAQTDFSVADFHLYKILPRGAHPRFEKLNSFALTGREPHA